ncbi:FKBP-type peptidyl-prolyl cis-trans isomerase [Thiococcus pfennigii]|uniref:FKBP-type peptidyl-prolyl cis-trans isomerase n=1 Tax=Thiococcus pfennigii TaxID=1057 RepID=UPI001906E0B0|nr:peptidylprolyl isomerase [Thiococcus pfennigii]MBK1700740.1 peptidylprolyl isomerase [Thiococcus pfennigii]MBK1732376.1 peptidylprolyl isomerase [Thiococcus pfennigii]
MASAQTGDTVKVHYTGTLDDGTVFDSSLGQGPIEFTLGAGDVIPGFDNAVLGMDAGESKTVVIPAGEAYGPRNDEMLQQIPRSAIPAEIELAEGMILHAEAPDGNRLSFTVVQIADEQVLIDGNHPLAGRDLTFALELVEIA